MSTQPELLREAVELLREYRAANSAVFPAFDEGQDAQTAWAERKVCADNAAFAFLAKIDAAEGDVPEVVAYRIVNHDSGTTITTDGLLYEAAKVAGMRVDWLAVVGGIPGTLAASGRQGGAR